MLIVVGGSRDQSYPNASSLLSLYPEKVGVINVDSHFDLRPIVNGKIMSSTPFRLLL